VLMVLMAIYRIPLTPRVLLLPFFLLLAMLTALGFGLWLSALNVRYRDVNYLVPFLVQIWMYLTPVIYGATLLPEQIRWLLALNPMSLVCEGFRWALLGPAAPASQIAQSSPWMIALSLTIVVVVLVTGLIFFRGTERTFADII
jgi:lipopolysaccharide transport system permease protein